MKKRLLSLALALCLLAALLPAGVLTAQAADFDPQYWAMVEVDSPESGGRVNYVGYTFDDNYVPHFDSSDYGWADYTYTWIDNGSNQVLAENQSLESFDQTQLAGKEIKLVITYNSLDYYTGYDWGHPNPSDSRYQFHANITTDCKGQIISRYDLAFDNNPRFLVYRSYGVYTYQFVYTFDPVCYPVKAVDLAMTPPVAGQPVDFSAVPYRPEELAISDRSENFHVHGVRWTDKTEGLAVTGGSFKAGHEYEASVYVEAADEYHYFQQDGPATATINGLPAQITDLTEDHSRYEITCSFPSSYVPVTGVTLNKTSTSIAAGNSETLTATVTPANAAAKGVVWSSSDPTVAKVDDSGRVTAVCEGKATVTATTKDGGKTASCLVSVSTPEEYDLEIDGVQVTSLNRRDVLGYGVFSFDGDHTLTVKGSYKTDKRLIYNKGIDGLVIRAEDDAILSTTSGEALITSKNTTITGPGKLMLRSSDDYGIFVAGRAATLTIADTTVDVSGYWGIAAPNRTNATKLVINHASVTAKGTSSAVSEFRGGITLKDCELVKPEGGSIIAWGDVVDAEGDRATEVQITPLARPNPFVDVAETDWFYNPVLWAYYNEPQITAGTDETHFSPYNTVMRSDAMVFFWAANDRPAHADIQSPFKDVKKKHWFYDAVLWAVENSITAGTDATHFSPNNTCSRSEILQFLYAAMNRPEYHISNPYSDVKPKHWYYDGAIWAYEYGLEKGEEGKYNAKTPCTRGCVVTYLYRFITGKELAE